MEMCLFQTYPRHLRASGAAGDRRIALVFIQSVTHSINQPYKAEPSNQARERFFKVSFLCKLCGLSRLVLQLQSPNQSINLTRWSRPTKHGNDFFKVSFLCKLCDLLVLSTTWSQAVHMPTQMQGRFSDFLLVCTPPRIDSCEAEKGIFNFHVPNQK